MKARNALFAGMISVGTGLLAAAAVGKPVPAPAAPAAAAPAVPIPPAAPLTAQQSAFFEAKVRPVLAANCYKCHSTEASKVKGGLLLDTREGWMKGGDTGPSIVPGDPTKSLFVKAITYADPDLQMPPKGEKLSDKEIADLTAWVKMGAPDPRTSVGAGPKMTGLTDKARQHWAYQPIKMSAVPTVKSAGWVKTPVDNFVLAKLEEAGMHPSPPASREALIRRATFDLIGLPPTPEEVQAFVRDQSPGAFEKVIDRLLASPHYGERWGRFWLDSARYSDTTGAENNAVVRRMDYRYAHAWTYRDYVINSFNSDKPYDEFLKEQIAADQLPGADKNPDTLAALGFITVGKRFANPNDQIDERIDAMCKSTMALTVACARCHDHKFDPIPTADYYSLHGIFNSIYEPDDKPLVGPKPNSADYEDFKQKVAALEAKDREAYYNLIQTKSAEFRSKATGYVMAMSSGRKNSKDDLDLRFKTITEFKLDRDLYQGGLKGFRKDDAVFSTMLRFAELPADQFAAKAKDVLADVQRGGGGGGGGARRTTPNALVVKAFREVKPEQLKSMRDVAEVYGKLFASIDKQAQAYLQAARTATKPEIAGYDPALVELINVPAPIEPAVALSTEKLKELAPRLPVVNQGAYQKFAFAEINELELTHPGAPGRAMTVDDSHLAKNSNIFIRGEAQNRGPITPRQFLEILSGPNRQPFTKGSGRLELAEAIASKSNPLTARVAINRIWAHHFGEGIVKTLDDIGVQSEPPSHPELLDYLASRFTGDPSAGSGQGFGWSMKKVHKLIMLSSAYQQSSDTNLTYAQKDPANRLIWRQNLRRLDFEAIRDAMLQFTGKIDLSLGGKPVNLTDEPYSNRRSVYGYIDRGNVPELMSQFDFSDPDMANSRRTSTIVPQQALFFMNSPMAVDVARKVTSRPEFTGAKDDAGRIKAIYEVLYQRAPRADEVKLAIDYLAGARIKDAENGTSPKATAAVDPAVAARRAAKLQQAKAAAGGGKNKNAKATIRNEGDLVERRPLSVWEEYAQALLFTNEVAYVN